MSDSSIKMTLIGGNLTSGSSDLIRTALGGYYNLISASAGESFELHEYNPKRPANANIAKVESNNTIEFTEVVNSNVLTPNKRFPIRIYQKQSVNFTDQQWADFVSSFANDKELEYINTEYNVSYNNSRQQVSMLESQGYALNKVDINFSYNMHLPHYQRYAMNTHYKSLPNFYLLSDAAAHADFDEDWENRFSQDEYDLVTCNGVYGTINSLFSLNQKAARADMGTRTTPEQIELLTDSKEGYKYSHLCTTYLTSALPRYGLSASTKQAADKMFGNIYMDSDAIYDFYKKNDYNSNINYFPYYAKISFPTLSNTGKIYESISSSNFSSKFLDVMARAFSNIGISEAPLRFKRYHFNEVRYEASYAQDNTVSVSEKTLGSTRSAKTINYLQLLNHCVNNYNITGNAQVGYYLGGATNPYRNRDYSLSSARYLSIMASAKAISDHVAYLSSSANFNVDSIKDIIESDTYTSEVLAYRIQKAQVQDSSRLSRTDGIADPSAGSALQNYWVFNPNMEEFILNDTQVQYGTEYRYSVYSYRTVKGIRYKYGDLIYTKQLHCDLVQNKYGLEFINGDPIFDTSPTRMQKLNEFATKSQVISEYPNLADMYLYWEPFVDIIEQYEGGNTVTISDAWPAKTIAKPYQIVDNSHTIGFVLNSGTHQDSQYGTCLNDEEELAKSNYLNSLNYLPEDKITTTSISKQDRIEVYRVTEKPTSLKDFNNMRLFTVSLAAGGQSNDCYKDQFYESKIATNQKYYYMFRTLNELGVPGHCSDVYQIELIDDGGYVYSQFKVLNELELVEPKEKKYTKPFKKLLQFRPRPQHTSLNTEDIEFDETAGKHIDNLTVGSAEQSIWDKTFKIRLTSKKTGQKLDLNITYKMQSEY